ncbi:MAG: OmpA family protein [Ginsengibacter sp.]
MAELHVERKKSSPLLWIIILIAILLLLFFLYRNYNNKQDIATTNKDSVTTSQTVTPATTIATTTPADWKGIDYNSPKTTYEEITNKDIDVRNSDKYAIYSLGQNIVFDNDKSTIRAGADANLKQIAASIQKRFGNSEVRIYGFTDNTGDKDYNKNLSEERAQAVKNWLIKDGNMNESKISLEPMGEAKPVATNSTEKGKQENRRVEIVVSRTN